MAQIGEIEAVRSRALTLLEDVLLSFGEPERPQFLQELPIRMTVWRAFAIAPDRPQKLLISPNSAVPLAVAVGRIRAAYPDAGPERTGQQRDGRSTVMALRNTIRAEADMNEFLSLLLPLTLWFRRVQRNLDRWLEEIRSISEIAIGGEADGDALEQMRKIFRVSRDKALWRFLAAWVVIESSTHPDITEAAFDVELSVSDSQLARWQYIERSCEALILITETDDVSTLPLDFLTDVRTAIGNLMHQMMPTMIGKLTRARTGAGDAQVPGSIKSVDLDRPVELAVHVSRRTVKVDAAERVFRGSASALTWAVIDSGIDATHPAFARTPPSADSPQRAVDPARSRVRETYDFNRLGALFRGDFAALVSPAALAELDAVHAPRSRNGPRSLDDAILTALYQMNAPRVPEALSERPLREAVRDDAFRGEVKEYLGDVRRRITSGEPIDWALLAPLLRMPHRAPYYEPPGNGHGTHVAGTIGGHMPPYALLDEEDAPVPDDPVIGMCPDINLIDLRVCDEDGGGDEFMVLAALQFIDHLNSAQDRMLVHGANVSLQIRHLVRNYGCGQTPVCKESDSLVASGVVVVAAAGNRGFNRLRTETGFVDTYSWSSITDPGNAEAVITVGATHRSRPHSFGVSYFSSRGPTGDGRQKPDLVAPGEKILAPYPGVMVQADNGTSMAAPHVSGAAALLLSRYPEFIGQPARIKEILCSTATDLGRRREFQGAGLVDVLRAMQAV